MRWLVMGALMALAILAVGAGAAYWWLGHRAMQVASVPVDVPPDSVPVPSDSASLAEGERAAWLRGCHGCHGDSLEGKVFLDEPRVMRLTAPNVTWTIRDYTDGELARLIRHGVTRTGRAIVAMPAATFYHLSDGDLGRIIAHLRRTTLREATPPPTEWRLLGRIGLVTGKVPMDARTMNHRASRLGDRRDTSQVMRGEYLTRTICSECHGLDLRGGATTPALAQALGYSEPEFVSLMLDGRSRSGRDIGLMGRTAQRRFVRFTRAEISAIWQYLRSLSLAASPS